MAWHDDMAIELPGGGGGGSDDGRDPDVLRNDIMDELADHLDCAMQRELRETDDEREARRRVLARFGEPARVAHRLWLDAMKGRLMAMKISIGLNVLLALTVLVVIWMMTNEIARGRDIAQMMMAEMQQSREALREAAEQEANVASDWANVVISVIVEESGEPVRDFHAYLSGKVLNETDSDTLDARADASGVATFGPIKPGSHNLQIVGPGNQVYRDAITVYPLRQQAVQVDWKYHNYGSAEASIEISYEFGDGYVEDLLRRDDLSLTPSEVQFIALQLSPYWNESRSMRWSWPGYMVILNGNGGIAVLSEDDPVFRMQNEALREALNNLTYKERISLPAGRIYRVSSVSIYGDVTSLGMFAGFTDSQRQYDSLDMPSEPTELIEWTVNLRRSF